ncbi:hypothetical protein SEA_REDWATTLEHOG_170 [Gordonia phage RedWattleHog]|uniref:Uncharacterized protein n=1 Tax=Gordonia phage Stormageddon TaxID=2656541 RepID=A0A649VS06_9CAUD|nr:hypothetical protein KHQ86_gp129 [Gordonia phage Stormageddon]QGJ95031.1 hypothetical protein SEA_STORMAGEDDON_171 [Gordonia phage Stormageddon]QLF83673.1 hypothetical protein SEA_REDWATTLEHOG_170 [Gordonia phage RedWattleHog]
MADEVIEDIDIDMRGDVGYWLEGRDAESDK